MKICVWKNTSGLHLDRPAGPSEAVFAEFDPQEPCEQCGDAVLSLPLDATPICPWCESGHARPKMRPHQQVDIVRLLERQSRENEEIAGFRQPLIGNKHTEKDLRSYLDQQGYAGRSARFLQLELAGIKRPGWLQVFRFRVAVRRPQDAMKVLHGVCRTDERNNLFQVHLLSSEFEQAQVLAQETEGLMAPGSAANSNSILQPLVLLLVLFLAVVGVVFVFEFF